MGLYQKRHICLTFTALLLVTSFMRIRAQENFNIRANLNRDMIVKYSEKVVEDFQERVKRFNHHHDDIEYFVDIYKNEKDQKFLRRYFSQHGVKGLRPFKIKGAKAYSRYKDVTISIGPVEALDHQIILDDKKYDIKPNQGLRSRIVQLENVVETHLKNKKTSNVSSFFSLIFPFQKAYAEQTQPQGEAYSQLIVAALIGATDNLHLHEDVSRDFSDKKLHENIKKMVSHIEEKSVSCQNELIVMKKMHTKDQMGADRRIPVASIQDFDTAGSISERLSDLLDRKRDMKSFIEMRDALTSHFTTYFTTRAERNMCRGVFAEAYEGGKENPELEKACASFDLLHDCLVEMRSIDRISELRRKEVSEKYHGGDLGPRKSRFPPKYKRQSASSSR